jgi:hypothetical protein
LVNAIAALDLEHVIIDDTDRAAVRAVLDTLDLSGTAATVAAYETALATWFATAHAVACSSGTAALHLALLATTLATRLRELRNVGKPAGGAFGDSFGLNYKLNALGLIHHPASTTVWRASRTGRFAGGWRLPRGRFSAGTALWCCSFPGLETGSGGDRLTGGRRTRWAGSRPMSLSTS